MKGILRALGRGLISLTGIALATIAGSLMLAFLVLDAFGFNGGPYSGILVFAVLPAVLVVGLFLIPIGNLINRRLIRRAVEHGKTIPPLPVIDFNKKNIKWIALFVISMTIINVALLAAGAYKAVEIMESTEFCGSTCHVMKPELTAYSRSPHAHVSCVNCHIGAGASWFVKSKLSGTRQLFAVAFNTYERPIQTPVHDLRPARETCEQCHWPARFAGDRLKIITSFTDDEKTEALKTVLLLNVGGQQRDKYRGIHWHVAKENRVRYLADKKRLNVAQIELSDDKGAIKKTFKLAPEAAAKMPSEGFVWRTMDCVDCHNRPTHIYGEPAEEVDAALLAERIDKDLPFIRREAVRIIQGDYASHEAARAEIPAALRAFYEKSYPDIAKSKAELIAHSAEALIEIYTTHVFPDMKIKWGTYPNFINHHNDSGCFRCHNSDQVDDKGKKISKDCDSLCHETLATESKKPEILDILYPE